MKTNVGYTVVAEFVIQDETAEKIEEAIQILKQWNPEWIPKFFMSLSDYSIFRVFNFRHLSNQRKFFSGKNFPIYGIP